MRVLVVKDGTVPVVVARVLAIDGELEPYGKIGSIDHEDIEVFEVEGEPEALDVTWADGEGFSVWGTTIETWFKDRQADYCGGPIETVDPRQGHLHFVQSDICHGEDEQWYSHLFILGSS